MGEEAQADGGGVEAVAVEQLIELGGWGPVWANPDGVIEVVVL